MQGYSHCVSQDYTGRGAVCLLQLKLKPRRVALKHAVPLSIDSRPLISALLASREEPRGRQ
jgi:hypothetical protein